MSALLQRDPSNISYLSWSLPDYVKKATASLPELEEAELHVKVVSAHRHFSYNLNRHRSPVCGPAKLRNGSWAFHSTYPTMIVFRVDDKVHGEVEMEDIELQRAASLKSSKTASKKQAGTGADSSKSTLSSEPGDVSQRAQRAVELAQQFLAEWSSLSPEARNNDSKGIDSAKMKLLELSMDRTGLNPEERSMESPLKTGFADAAPSPVA